MQAGQSPGRGSLEDKAATAGISVQFINDNNVNKAPAARSTGRIPYMLTVRTMTKVAVSPIPNQNMRFRRSRCCSLNHTPKTYPAAITPTHGTSG
jgi:hypothetical protein